MDGCAQKREHDTNNDSSDRATIIKLFNKSAKGKTVDKIQNIPASFSPINNFRSSIKAANTFSFRHQIRWQERTLQNHLPGQRRDRHARQNIKHTHTDLDLLEDPIRDLDRHERIHSV